MSPKDTKDELLRMNTLNMLDVHADKEGVGHSMLGLRPKTFLPAGR